MTFSGAFLPGDYFFLGKENQVTLFSGDFFVIRLQKKLSAVDFFPVNLFPVKIFIR